MNFNPLTLFRRDNQLESLRSEVQALQSELGMAQQMDGFQSQNLGFGTPEDKAVSDWKYAAEGRLDWRTLDSLLASNGLARRIVDHPVNEATREWLSWTVDRKVADKISALIEERNLIQIISKAARTARGRRGGVVVLDVDDGQPVDSPVEKNRIRDAIPRFVVDARRAIPVDYRDPWTPVTHYDITTSNYTRYHTDRLLVFDGLDSGDENRLSNYGWGESIIDILWEALRNYCTDYGMGSSILKDQSVMVFKTEDFAEKVKKGGAKWAIKQARARRKLISAVQALLMGKEEEFEYVNRNVSGIADIIHLAKEFLCAMTGIPHSELFGESPGASLGEGGAYQSRSFYNMVRMLQRDTLSPQIRKYMTYLAIAHKLPQEISFQWRSLWQLTPKEKSEVYEKTANGDQKYWQMGVLDTDHIESRFSADGFSQDIAIEPGEELDDIDEGPEPQDEDSPASGDKVPQKT